MPCHNTNKTYHPEKHLFKCKPNKYKRGTLEYDRVERTHLIKEKANFYTLFPLPPSVADDNAFAVSTLLMDAGYSASIGPAGLNPEQFKHWGEAGRGKHVTLYTRTGKGHKPGNVVLEIDGKFFARHTNVNNGAGLREMRTFNPDKYTIRRPWGQ